MKIFQSSLSTVLNTFDTSTPERPRPCIKLAGSVSHHHSSSSFQPGPKQAVLVHIALTPPLEDPSEKIDLWVAQHAKQVSRMLPGGVDVLGVAALCAPDVFEKQKSLIKKVSQSEGNTNQ